MMFSLGSIKLVDSLIVLYSLDSQVSCPCYISVVTFLSVLYYKISTKKKNNFVTGWWFPVVETVLEKEIGKTDSINLILRIFCGNGCGISEFCLKIKHFDFHLFYKSGWVLLGVYGKKIFICCVSPAWSH